MGKEIERKFLVSRDLWYAIKKPEGTPFIQSYIVNEKDRVVRLRIAGSEAFLTIKGAVKEITRSEFEYKIPVEDAREMLQLFTRKQIEKNRCKFQFGNHTWEVDEFFGENDGLIIAEIELKSQEESFERPSWLGEEVTNDHRYYNSYLINHPFCKW